MRGVDVVTGNKNTPITPTAIIPAGQPLPAPAGQPPPPPIRPAPPAPPASPDPPPWWTRPRPAPPPPVPVDVHVTVTVDLQGPPDPPPDPWWRRIRWGYHALMVLLAFPVSGPWAKVLDSVRDEEGLPAAWVMAAIVWALAAVWDNVSRIRALHAHPDAWLPKCRAGIARLLLYAAITATVLTLPITTLVYWITGVDTP
jgi:hypothetical protein